MTEPESLVTQFIIAACVPRDASHSSGTLEWANAILTAYPDIGSTDIHTAAVLGDDVLVREFLDADRASATAKGGPYDWDPLTHLCFSRYLKLDATRSHGFVRAATALLDAGASAATGWWEPDHQPAPEWESALYGACGVAHHPELTRLLLERGADPNDDETVYHTPETYDNRALEVLVQSGRPTADSLTTMLIRKHDWHDVDGARYLLEHGADPNRMSRWGVTAMHQALLRNNGLPMIELLLDHGANPALAATLPWPGDHVWTSILLAGYSGRDDVLRLLTERGIPVTLSGVDALVAACASDNSTAIAAAIARDPHLADGIVALGGTLLARFAGNGNALGVSHLLDLGIDVATPFAQGDGYFDIPPQSLAIHVAAWRGFPAVVKLLIDRGSPVDAPDANGRTPLALAVRACVDSYWTVRRSPESVGALLDAGASPTDIPLPTGYAEADALLRLHGR